MTQHPDNIRRANSASRGLDAYRQAACNDDDESGVLRDLIADLGHFADQHDIDFLYAVRRAIADWSVERRHPSSDNSDPFVGIHFGEGGQP